MSDVKVNVDAGKPVFGLATVLTLIFVVLKLAEVGAVAHWSWLWVLSPLWISFGLVCALVLLFLLFALIVAIWAR